MAKYRAWHPAFGPEEFEFIENAFQTGLEWIREYKKTRVRPILNNVIIERADLPRPIKVCVIRGKHLE